MDANIAFELPEDILRLIVDSYATCSSKNDALRLLRVSRDIKSWLEPHVYSKVILKSSRQVIAFAAALRGEYIFCHPGRYVKSLWLLCADPSATQLLSGVVEELCPNLVHFAFHGKKSPIIYASASASIEGEETRSRPTRLTLCSPALLDLSFYNEHPPIRWEHLTHLHILGPGDINDSALYDRLLGDHIDHFTSLTHLCIELIYPSPESEIINYTFFSEAALFYVYVNEGFFRDMFKRVPSLRNIHIKTSFTYPRFRILWDDLRKLLEDVKDLVTFEMKALSNQDFYENALPGCEVMGRGVWTRLIQNALEETERKWMTDS